MPLSVEDGKRLIELEAEMARRGELPARGAGRDLTETLFGAGTAKPASDVWTSKTGWTKEMVEKRIRSEAVKQKVDPNLAVAVAYHESGFDPDIEGDGGNAHGVFQLHKGAATDAGINPKFRKDPDLNIYGGVRYLKMKLDQSKGNVEEALSRYNRGTPDYRGIGDPNYIQRVLRYYPGTSQPQQTAQPSQPGLLARMGNVLSPASAEAATPAPRPAPQVPAAPRSRLEELEAELARRDAQPGTYTDTDVQNAMKTLQTPQAPTGGTYTNEDVQNALRSLQGTTAPAPAGRDLTQELFGTPPQATAATPAEEPITPERRFLDLPSSQQMSLEDRTQRFQEFYRLKPELKEEFLRSEEPQSDLAIDIEKPSTPQPGAVQTPPTGPASSTRIEPLPPGASELAMAEVNRPAPLPVPPEAAIAAIPGMAGYALGLKIAPALGAVGKVVPPLLEAAGGYLGRRANVKLGYEKEGLGGDILSALPLATRALGAATSGWLERTIKEAPVAARDQTMDLLSKLFSRGGAQGTLTYLLSGDPQLAAWVGGSYATARSLLGFALRHPIGKQLVEQTLKAGRAIGGAELGMLLQIGRTGKAPAALMDVLSEPPYERTGKAPKPAQEQDLASSRGR